MSSIRIGAITTLFAFLFGTLAAFAQSTTVSYSTDVYSAPDKSAAVSGYVQSGMTVDVAGCRGHWCQINFPGGAGWVPADAVAQSVPQPQPQPTWPQPTWPQPQPVPLPTPTFPWPEPQPPVYDDEAGACFYSERNFGGYSFCLEEGDTAGDLRNWDNRIRSVEIFGGARVDLCRDEDFDGACITLRSDTARLPSQLDRRASSLEVY